MALSAQQPDDFQQRGIVERSSKAGLDLPWFRGSAPIFSVDDFAKS